MLRQLRKKKTMKRILWALAIVIVPVFVLWGAGSMTKPKEDVPSYVGEIYGRKVPFEKFAKSYGACFHQLMLSYGGNYELLKKAMEAVNINEIAWQRLVMLEEAKRERIKVTDRDVIERISSFPFFKTGNAFNNDLYNHILRNSLRTTPREFEEETRENLAIARLENKVSGKTDVTDDEVLKEYKEENEKVRISYVLVNPQDFIKNIQLSDEDLKTFYENNSAGLKRGEEAKIKYIFIAPDNAEALHKIAPEVGKKSLDTVAAENNLKLEETGFFGAEEEIPGIGWAYELVKAAFSLKIGAVSNPIYITKGYYIISVKEKRKNYIPPFEEVKALLEKRLVEGKAIELAGASASDIYKNLSEAIKKGAGFEKAAEGLNLKAEKSKPFSRREYIEGIGEALALKEAAFSAGKGELNGPVVCEKGFVIFGVDELIPSDEKKLEGEKETLKQRLISRKKEAAFGRWFEGVSKNTKLFVNLDRLSH